MSDEVLSDSDAAVRERISEPSVHVSCGQIRGPVRVDGESRWQSCPCEDTPDVWEGCDVSRKHDLCLLCARATAGGTSSWSWLACAVCRTVAEELATDWGFTPFELGRHPRMNGYGIHIQDDDAGERLERACDFRSRYCNLEPWRILEVSRLAVVFADQQDIPLELWLEQWNYGRLASKSAIRRLIRRGESSPDRLSNW
jgi:hypothetical protein